MSGSMRPKPRRKSILSLSRPPFKTKSKTRISPPLGHKRIPGHSTETPPRSARFILPREDTRNKAPQRGPGRSSRASRPSAKRHGVIRVTRSRMSEQGSDRVGAFVQVHGQHRAGTKPQGDSARTLSCPTPSKPSDPADREAGNTCGVQ